MIYTTILDTQAREDLFGEGVIYITILGRGVREDLFGKGVIYITILGVGAVENLSERSDLYHYIGYMSKGGSVLEGSGVHGQGRTCLGSDLYYYTGYRG